jgi:hypothetical protein
MSENNSNKIVVFNRPSLEYFLNDLKNINDDLHKEFKIFLISSFNNNNGNENQKCQQQTKCLCILKKYIDENNISQIFPECFIKIQFVKKYNFEHKKPIGI